MRSLLLFLLPLTAFAETAEIRLQGQLWSRTDGLVTLIGGLSPVSMSLVAPAPGAGEFELGKLTIASPELTAKVVVILSVKNEPHQLVFQTLLSNSVGEPIAQCSSIQTVHPAAVYGVGACTGFSQGKQLGITFYRD